MVKTFVENLASAAPTPGGGGASALAGGLAAALSSMVGNLTVGKKRYASVEADMYISLEKLSFLRERLLELIEEDARAFGPLAEAYGMPKATLEEQEAQQHAMQDALVGACEVPLEIMRRCAEVIEQCEFMAESGSRIVVSDAGVAVVLAKAALQGASLNVRVNVPLLADQERAEAYTGEMNVLLEQNEKRADRIYESVLSELG